MLPFNLDLVQENPASWMQTVTFDSATALIDGADLASAGSLLRGFREWLIVKNDRGHNLTWQALVLMACFPESENPRMKLDALKDQTEVVNQLFTFLEEYWQRVTTDWGLRTIYHDYEKWLKRQSWYKPHSPHWLD